MKPLFVSYTGKMGGNLAHGWVVLVDHPLLESPENMTALVDRLEADRKYDPGSLVLVNFRRLEGLAP